MKTKLFIIVSCGLLLLAAGCKKNKDKDLVSFVGNQPIPTWTAPTQYDMTNSMTAVVRIDLARQFPITAADFEIKGNDLLAAFIGGKCVGVASPQDGLFYLYITGQTTDSEMVSLRYYSAHYKNLFEAVDVFPFRNDTNIGTVAEPYVPMLVVFE